VDHQSLIDKLECYGIRGKALDLFTSYVTNRSQEVKINDVYSNSLITKHRVPQGTVLGPILFIIYVNGLLNLKINGSIISYADDIVILVKAKSENELYKLSTLCLKIVKTWLDNNMLQINFNKSRYMFFRLSNATQNFTKPFIIHRFGCLNLDNYCSCIGIQNVSVIKYLGIVVDEIFKWSTHIQHITVLIRKLFHVFKNLRKILSPLLLRMIYFSLAQSILSYGIEIWGGTYNTHLVNLQITINGLIQIILHKPRLHSTVNLFNEFRIFNLKALYFKNILLHLFKTDITMLKPHHSYNTRLKTLSNLNCIKVTKNFEKFNTINVGIDLCRKLNIDMTNFKTKRMLINYLNTIDLNNLNL